MAMNNEVPNYTVEQNLDSLKLREEETFTCAYSSPSNIALVKYWGKKKGTQIPANPSVSITLDQAKTEIKMKAKVRQDRDTDSWISLSFEGKPMAAFIPKLVKFFENVESYLPAIRGFHFNLETSNTFPHSAGIASSASSMSALACALVDFEQWLLGRSYDEDKRKLRSSFFARLGSGSACRSIYAQAASWGAPEDSEGISFSGSDLVAHQVDIHPELEGLYDTILIVDAGEKKVSSRAGHGLMKDHPYAQARFIQAQSNWKYTIQWLKEGQWDYLGAVIEEEAMALHAMMMTSRPGYILMAPQTIEAIHKLREFRYESGVPLYFTLDAGPNLHLLYPASAREEAFAFIQNELVPSLKGARILDDRMGTGSQKIL